MSGRQEGKEWKVNVVLWARPSHLHITLINTVLTKLYHLAITNYKKKNKTGNMVWIYNEEKEGNEIILMKN